MRYDWWSGSGGGGPADVDLPPSCDLGCEFIIPLDHSASDEPGVLDVTLVVTYVGSASESADQNEITIEPTPADE